MPVILNRSHVVSVEPSVEPVTVEQAKRNSDVDDDSRDADFARWIAEARKEVELDCRRALITQTHVVKLDCFPGGDFVELPYPPLATVTSITYVDTDGSSQTLSTSVYTVDTNRTPGIVYLSYNQVWPAIRGDRNSVTITYTCGYGATAASVPEAAINAILLLVKHRYEMPELAIEGSMSAVPKAYDWIIAGLKWGQYP